MRQSVCLLASAAMLTLAEAATLRVDVGLGGLVFTPNSTTAAMGDVVEFHFHPKDHNVVQSSFDSPCDFGSLPNPIYSGFMPVSSGEGTSVFQVTVNSTSPIWFYCGQGSHCEAGMVGVINEPSSGNTLAAYAAKAKTASASTNPQTVGGGVVVQNSNSTSPSTSTSSSYPGASSASSGTASATSSGASATPSKAGAVSLQAVSWSELFGMGAVIGGAAILMQ